MKTINGTKRSKIIVDIIMDKIDISQALEILDLLLQDLNNEEIKKWVNSEIYGYGQDDKLPDYRIINTSIVGTVRTYTAIYNNLNIPLAPEDEEEFRKVYVREGINEIVQLAKAEEQGERHFLEIPMNLLLINHYAKVEGEVTCASRRLSLYAYTNIIGKLKSKILSILKELEKQYGNLDEYYIEFDDIKKEQKIVETIVNMINPVNIGNGNKIDKSIIGDKNGN